MSAPVSTPGLKRIRVLVRREQTAWVELEMFDASTAGVKAEQNAEKYGADWRDGEIQAVEVTEASE